MTSKNMFSTVMMDENSNRYKRYFDRHIKCIVKPIVMVMMASSITQVVYADQLPDLLQRGSTNIAYDNVAKMYVGASFDYNMASSVNLSTDGQVTALNNDAPGYGFFVGRRWNNFYSVELGFNYLGKIDADSSSYVARPFDLHVDFIGSYPVLTNFNQTISLYAKAGYGLAMTYYNYNYAYVTDSGMMYRGAYDLGLGINWDWRNNVSIRLGYTLTQAYYPTITGSSKHSLAQAEIGLYYNF